MTKCKIYLCSGSSVRSRSVERLELDGLLAPLSVDPRNFEEYRLGNERFRSRAGLFDPDSWVSIAKCNVTESSGQTQPKLLIDFDTRWVGLAGLNESEFKGTVVDRSRADHSIEIPYTLPDHWTVSSDIDRWLAFRQEPVGSKGNRINRRRILFDSVCDHVAEQSLRWIAETEWSEHSWMPPNDWTWRHHPRCIDGSLTSPRLEDALLELQSRWLQETLTELRGRSPWEVLKEHRDWIERDLWDREYQWSATGKCPPVLDRSLHSFRWAGFGMHESILYIELVRELLRFAAAELLMREAKPSLTSLIRQLFDRRDTWLETPYAASEDGKSPQQIMVMERRREPWCLMDHSLEHSCDCSLCRSIGVINSPVFVHLEPTAWECDRSIDSSETGQVSDIELPVGLRELSEDIDNSLQESWAESSEPDSFDVDLAGWPLTMLLLTITIDLDAILDSLPSSAITAKEKRQMREATASLQQLQEGTSSRVTKTIASLINLLSAISIDDDPAFEVSTRCIGMLRELERRHAEPCQDVVAAARRD